MRLRWFDYLIAATSVASLLITAHALAGAPAKSSDVRIEVDGGTGSGVYIGDGRIVTVAHVVDGKQYVTVITPDGKQHVGAVKWTDTEADTALVLVVGLDAAAAPLACEQQPIGTPIEIVGQPFGYSFVHSWGRIASAPQINDMKDGQTIQFVDANILPGNSGGGVYADDKLVGLADAQIGNDRGFLSVMVPATVLCDRLEA